MKLNKGYVNVFYATFVKEKNKLLFIDGEKEMMIKNGSGFSFIKEEYLQIIQKYTGEIPKYRLVKDERLFEKS